MVETCLVFVQVSLLNELINNIPLSRVSILLLIENIGGCELMPLDLSVHTFMTVVNKALSNNFHIIENFEI